MHSLSVNGMYYIVYKYILVPLNDEQNTVYTHIFKTSSLICVFY